MPGSVMGIACASGSAGSLMDAVPSKPAYTSKPWAIPQMIRNGGGGVTFSAQRIAWGHARCAAFSQPSLETRAPAFQATFCALCLAHKAVAGVLRAFPKASGPREESLGRYEETFGP